MTLNRRRMLLATGAAMLGPGVLARVGAGTLAPKKVLFFTKSSGFEHSAIAEKDGKPSHAGKILEALGKEHGFEVVTSKDGGMFEPGKIEQWDAFVFYTTGNLLQPGTDKQPPMTEAGFEAFIDRVRSGKAGFVGVHSATDTMGDHRGLGDKDPYTQMIGGQFNGHGAQQEVELIVTDPKFPGAEGLKPKFRLTDEWYSQKYQPADLHIVVAHDTSTMEGDDYKRPNYGQTWARKFGDGRVYYNSMGHREDVWENPLYQGMLVGALMWATGQAEADVTPNGKDVAPEYQTTEK
jgi:type 1 glutamine amidotransferase